MDGDETAIDEMHIELRITDKRGGPVRFGVNLTSERAIDPEVIKGIVGRFASSAVEDVKTLRARAADDRPGQLQLMSRSE